MKGKMCMILLFILLSSFHTVFPDTVIWTGNVNSNGSRTPNIRLQNGRDYYFIVEGSVYFGKWRQNRQSLLNDACCEFNARPEPQYLPVFNNSLGAPFNNTAYRSNHVYRSKTFRAIGHQSICFWIFDPDYRDNRGSLRVRLIIVDQVQPRGSIVGTWIRSGNKYILRWKQGGWVDTLTLSKDGRKLEGKNQYSSRVWAIKK